MPLLVLNTNVKIADPKSFTLEFSKFSAETLAKPESYITVQYNHNEFITFGGTHEPAFNLTIYSLDNLQPEKNEVYSKKLSEWLNTKLGLKSDRGYITFIDPGRSHIGYAVGFIRRFLLLPSYIVIDEDLWQLYGYYFRGNVGGKMSAEG